MTDAEPAIVVRDLRKVYGSKAAVDGLNLTVPRGSFFGFLGPNGAGKSTTIRMLTGLIPPTSGSIELLGMRMPDEELEIKRRIGLVPDESMLFDRLTGLEFLEFVGRMYSLERAMARHRAEELLEVFELSGEKRKLISEYSKGMRKRVAMAAFEIATRDCYRARPAVDVAGPGSFVVCQNGAPRPVSGPPRKTPCREAGRPRLLRSIALLG